MYNFLTKNGQTIAFLVGGILVVAFYALAVLTDGYDLFTQMDMDNVKDPERYGYSGFDFGLIITIALIVLGYIAMFGFGLFQTATNIKGSLGALAGLAVIGIIFAVGYNATELYTTGLEADAAKKFQLSDPVRKFVGGSAMTGFALIALATLGVVVSEIRNFFK